MKKSVFVLVCFMLCAFVFGTGCTQDVIPAPATTTVPVTSSPSADTVRAVTTSLGTVLTDARGMTLYFFTPDSPGSGNSTCYGQCESFWPVFYTASPVVSPPLAPADFSVITRTDGKKQTTYKGWPLYYYLSDTQPGDLKGEGVTGNWFVAKPDYSIMLLRQPGAGEFLTDGSGKTLYYLATEKTGETACTGSCLTNWPAFSSGPLVAPSILKTADFAGTQRPDGARQSLYKGRLLYYFTRDAKPGEMNGQGVNNVWYVANSSGFVPPVPTPVPTTVPTTSPTIDYGSDSDSSSDSGGGGGGY